MQSSANIASKLNCYILPGRITDVRVGLAEAKAAEAKGLGGVFLSEKWESKEIGSAMGALSQVTERVRLVTGLTHFGTRHPLVLAGMSATMQKLSSGRFVLGFGRSVPAKFRRLGIPVLNNAAMADYVGILRKLWTGETINYRGPVGEFPEMKLALPCSEPPPIIIGAIGPKTLALAGAHFDGVVLHPFLTPEGAARSVKIVRNAAMEAGRDPTIIKIYATVVTVLDGVSQAERAEVLEARAVSYFMHREVGSVLIDMNGWDRGPMERLIEAGLADADFAAGNFARSREHLARAVDMLPPWWLTSSAAVGDARACVARLGEYLDAGADELLFHGAKPEHQAQVIDAF